MRLGRLLQQASCLLPLLTIIVSIFVFPTILADRKFCGTGLADTLRLLCGGRYKNSAAHKRAVLTRHTRDTKGVTQECCTKPCSLPTLLSYCAAGPSASDGPMASLMSGFAGASGGKGFRLPGSTQEGSKDTAAGGASSSKHLLGSSRIKGLAEQGLDLSPLVPMRPDEYESSMPYRQR